MLSKRKRVFCAAAAIAILTVNVWQCPVDVFSGGKKPGWESRKSPYYSDRYFPYRQAIQWLKQNHPKTPVIIGSTHPDGVGFRWTCARYKFRPNAKFIALDRNKGNRPGLYRKSLEKTLKTAAQYKVPLVMVDKKDDSTVIHDDERSLYGYTATKLISNKYQSIIFYSRDAQ